jgi:hypothetical protein
MKIRVKFSISDRNVDEVVSAPDSDSLLAFAKERVTKELGWKGMFLRPLSPLQFAQLVVSKYNENFGTDFATPTNGDDFIKFGLATGNVELIEP